jgi:hypothetical protein
LTGWLARRAPALASQPLAAALALRPSQRQCLPRTVSMSVATAPGADALACRLSRCA